MSLRRLEWQASGDQLLRNIGLGGSHSQVEVLRQTRATNEATLG
jgi:hypothetical protein